ncbi:adenosinetriphosphatase, partial [Trypanosoma cruzi]
ICVFFWIAGVKGSRTVRCQVSTVTGGGRRKMFAALLEALSSPHMPHTQKKSHLYRLWGLEPLPCMMSVENRATFSSSSFIMDGLMNTLQGPHGKKLNKSRCHRQQRRRGCTRRGGNCDVRWKQTCPHDTQTNRFCTKRFGTVESHGSWVSCVGLDTCVSRTSRNHYLLGVEWNVQPSHRLPISGLAARTHDSVVYG